MVPSPLSPIRDSEELTSIEGMRSRTGGDCWLAYAERGPGGPISSGLTVGSVTAMAVPPAGVGAGGAGRAAAWLGNDCPQAAGSKTSTIKPTAPLISKGQEISKRDT